MWKAYSLDLGRSTEWSMPSIVLTKAMWLTSTWTQLYKCSDMSCVHEVKLIINLHDMNPCWYGGIKLWVVV